MALPKIGLEAVFEFANFVKGINQYKKGITGAEKSTGKATKSFDKLGKSWTELNSQIQVLERGLGKLKKVYDFAKEGASVDQTEQSFNRLMDTLDVGPDILQRMSDATLGTVDDMTLMSSTMTLLAGTSTEMGQAIVGASPKLLEIAKAANKLNPTLGDTSFLYNSLATGIKRSSPLILDNLGLVIKIGEANEKWAQANGVAVESMTAEQKQMALLNATLEAGDRMIQQVGGSTESMADNFARAEASLKNTTDQLKKRLVPVMAELAVQFNKFLIVVGGDLPKELAKTYDATEDASKSFEQLAEEARKAKVQMFGTEAEKENVKIFWWEIDNLVKLTADDLVALGLAAGATWPEIMKFAEAEGVELGRDAWADYAEEVLNAKNAVEPWIERAQEAERRAAAAANATVSYTNTLADLSDVLTFDATVAAAAFNAQLDILHQAISGEVGKAFDELKGKVYDLRSELSAGEITQKEYSAALNEATQAFEENTKAIIFNIAEKQILDALEKGLIADANASGTAYDEATVALYAMAEGLGLVDEGTLALTQKVIAQTDAFISGRSSIGQWVGGMNNLAGSMGDAATRAGDLTAAINSIPSYKKVVVEYYQSGGTGPAPELGFPEDTPPPPGAPMQHGGPVTAGQPYMVGEAGPELFIPDQPGIILPNDWTTSLPATGSSTSNVIHLTMSPTINNGMDLAEFQALTLQTVRQAIRGT